MYLSLKTLGIALLGIGLVGCGADMDAATDGGSSTFAVSSTDGVTGVGSTVWVQRESDTGVK